MALGSLGNTVSSSNGSFTTLKEIISSAKEKLNTILSELNEVEDGEKYDQFIRILSTDPEVMGEFFASPVTINTERVYPVENYGSSVTPFYTILALWVGAVILVALIKVQVEDESFAGARSYQRYFGRFLLFFVLGSAAGSNRCPGRSVSVKSTVFGTGTFLYRCCVYKFYL